MNNKQENSFMKIPFFVMKLFFLHKIVIFMNEFGNFVAIKVLVVNSKPHGHRSNLLEFEYKILDFNSD